MITGAIISTSVDFRQNRVDFVSRKLGDNRAENVPNESPVLRTNEDAPHFMQQFSDNFRQIRERREQMSEEARAAREAAEAQAQHWRDLQKAMEIAARIMRGDNVPQQDKDFLMQVSPAMFKLAMAMRNHDNENPTDYEALSDGANDTSAEAAAAMTAAATPAAPTAAVSGGDTF
ncbi:MAG: hypothetical protein LBE35_02840 [Clostridiales bacterium]|jgi:DNA-binding protein H-NS|nr:hypothetical protein [Clostridiales bacterium]